MIIKSAAIVIQNKSVLYLRKRGLLFYILPGGKIEKGETREQALEREMLEEVQSRIQIIENMGVITAKGFNKSLDKLETVRLYLYHTQLLDPIQLSREIFDQTFIQYKNMHRYLLTPVGIRVIEFLYQKGLIE